MYKPGLLLAAAVMLGGCDTVGSEYNASGYYSSSSAPYYYRAGYYPYNYSHHTIRHSVYRPVVRFYEPPKPPRSPIHGVHHSIDRHYPTGAGIRHTYGDYDKGRHSIKPVTGNGPQSFTRDENRDRDRNRDKKL